MKINIPFAPADILLPKNNFEKWSVIACDQFTSDKKYWAETEATVGNAESTLKITLPEIYLEEGDTDKRIASINCTMAEYLNKGILEEYKNAMIYIERTQPDGRVRKGIIGAVDLEHYDYRVGSKTLIRATEGTVLERIPPRVKIRKDAPLELPHIMLLIDDINNTVIEPLSSQKDKMQKVYDFDLMMGGGHIAGYLIDKDNIERINVSLAKLNEITGNELLFAVGDGNHSLATAKECYEILKRENQEAAAVSAARYALAEVGNIHSEALDFEPIYRVMFSVDPCDVLAEFKKYFSSCNANSDITVTYGTKEEVIKIHIPSDKLSTGVIQEFIDSYIYKHPEAKVDYIHGINDVKALSSKENTIGFIYDGISKETLFESVKATGALPRKTFSMGESRDKRYYLECRKIK